MSASTCSQHLSGPFSEKDLPDYQAAVQHVRSHWRRLLSATQLEAVEYIMDATARFGKRARYMQQAWLLRGLPASHKRGFAGIAPITPVSRQALSKALSGLQRLGILSIDSRGFWSLNYSITALHLAEDDEVQKRVLAANRRGGILSTIEGLLQWAAEMVQRYVQPQENKAATYTFTPNRPNTSSDKSSEGAGFNFGEQIKEWFMGQRSAQQIAADALANVRKGQQRYREKRKTSGTLASRMQAFELAWGEGQRKAERGIPTRIDPRGKKLIKDQLLKRADPAFDCNAFAAWVAEHWQAIGAQYFSRSKSYPAKPVIPWLIKTLEVYIEAFENKDMLDETGTLSTKDAGKAIKRSKVTVERAEQAIDDANRRAELANARVRELEAELEKHGIKEDDDGFLTPKMKRALKYKIGKYDDE